jgi:signal transduction histidine kinase
VASARPRPTLALLLDNLFEGYEEQLWRTIVRATAAEDVSLLCFLAGPARGQRLERLIFDLPGPETVDAIIGLFGTLNMGRDGYHPPATERMGREANGAGCFADGEVHAFLRRYAGLPVVSLGKLVPGVPSLLVDNDGGVEAIVDHLVAVHGRRRIVFVCGPDLNEEAEARLRGYRAALARHDLPFDPALVCPGDFTAQAGPQAVRALLDERRVSFDALVGANDLMAIHAMHALQRRGVRVPDDVAVVGFDDQRDAASVLPQLSTVCQPLREMGIAAVQQALALLRGRMVPETTIFPTRPVYRRSCGCAGQAEPARKRPRPPRDDAAPQSGDGVAGLAGSLEAAHSWVTELPGGIAAELVQALEAEVRGGSTRFLRVLDAAVSAGIGAGIAPGRWHAVLQEAFAAFARRLPDRGGEPLLALLARAVALVGERAEHLQAARSYELETEALVLQHVFRITGVQEAEFTAALQAQLPKLGVGSFYLARVTDPELRSAALEYHYALSDNVTLDPAPGPYAARRLVPGRFTTAHRYAYQVMPLHFGAEVTGFAVCEIGSMSGSGYESLANQLGRAFQASALMKEVRRYAEELEVRVEERARQLKEAQQQLVEIAHEAGMAEIAVGALHNVGNLLTSVSVSAEAVAASAGDTAVSGLLRLTELLEAQRKDLAGFFAADPRAALVPGYCRELARSLELDRDRIRAEAAELVANVALVRETVATLQDYARDGRDRLLVERLDPALLIEASLKLQAANLTRHRVQVRRRLDRVPPAPVQRFKVIHALVNLIKNGVEAMERTPEDARVLSVELAAGPDGSTVITIGDAGEGISPDAAERLFSYGFTTKPGGHGFGLHSCANDVRRMGGRIVAESEGCGQGARFRLVLPAAPTLPE